MKKSIKDKNNTIALVLGIGIVVISAIISSLLINTQSKWFVSLAKPTFMPPPIVFTLAWTVIYVLMALIITKTLKEKNYKLLYLWISLNVLNILWTLFFSRLQMPLIGIIILAIATAISIILSFIYTKRNDYLWALTLPIALWYIFALFLNYSIIMLN